MMIFYLHCTVSSIGELSWKLSDEAIYKIELEITQKCGTVAKALLLALYVTW